MKRRSSPTDRQRIHVYKDEKSKSLLPSVNPLRVVSSSPSLRRRPHMSSIVTLAFLCLAGISFCTLTVTTLSSTRRDSDNPRQAILVHNDAHRRPLMVQLQHDNDTSLAHHYSNSSLLLHVTRTHPTLPKCIPFGDWQLSKYAPSTGNTLHEVWSNDDIRFINCGGSRCAFAVTDQEGNQVVLKTPKLKE